MKSKKSVEDYLESILVLGDHVHAVMIANKNNVSKAAVTKALKKLVEMGFVEMDFHHVVLTKEGKAYAERVFNKHNMIKMFLLKLGVTEEVAEKDACQAEHILSEDTIKAIERFMDEQS